jgi:type IV pilus assembly protein PilA
MSFKNIKANYKKGQSGFTIVELLIVIVVIGILAAITIVAYNGVTARANTTSAQAAASSVVKKVEAYNAEEAGYPADPTDLTGADPAEVYALTGVSFDSAALSTSNLPTSPSQVTFYRCGVDAAAAATNLATVTNVSGVRVDYWNYTSGAVESTSAGIISGTVNTYNVTCYITAA